MGIDAYLAALGVRLKTCSNCGKSKSLQDFHVSAKSSDGKASWCKHCALSIPRDRSNRVRRNSYEQKRKWQLMSRYKMTPEDVEKLCTEQKNACAICLTCFSETGNFHVDHCHNTGEVRGLLCHRCNIRLGGWDDLVWRSRAMTYLGIAA